MPEDKVESTSKSCAFCVIASGGSKSYEVFRDPVSMSFLDRRPVFRGHCLLIPLTHLETMTDLPQELIAPLLSNAKKLAAAVEIGLKAEGTFIAINNRISQSIPHLHIHIVPRRHGDGLRGFFWPRTKYGSEEELSETRNAIVSAMTHLQAQ